MTSLLTEQVTLGAKFADSSYRRCAAGILLLIIECVSRVKDVEHIE